MPRQSTKIPVTCEHCSVTFYRAPSLLTQGRGRGRFCSNACKWAIRADQRTPVVCGYCEQAFYVTSKRLKPGRKSRAKYCSLECKRHGWRSHTLRQAFDRSCGTLEHVGDCVLWGGSLTDKGYGILYFRLRAVGAHRAAYILRCGDIPDGLDVLHRCDTPRCINPDHLFLGTQTDNNADMVRKGRQFMVLTPEQVRQIHRLRAAGMAYQAIADHFGMSQSHIWRIVNGIRRAGVSPVADIVAILPP